MTIHSEWLGRTIMVEIDCPAGCIHPRLEDTVFAIHFGFIPGTRGDDGFAIDVYVFDDPGAIDPSTPFEATVIAIVHRKDDGQDKLVVSASGQRPTAEEVEAAVEFQEKWFKHTVEVLSPHQ